MLRHADRVRVGCLAQIVNVIAPLMTNENQVLRQSIYYPYAWALKHARGRVLDLLFESETYEVPQFGAVPYLDVAATFDPANGQRCLLALNRDLKGDRELTVIWQDSPPARVVVCETLTGPDLKAANSFDQPKKVVPQPLDAPTAGSKMVFKLPPRSYTVAVMAS